MKERSDEELVARCLEGDGAAWSVLVERYQQLVYSIPRRYRLPPEEAADVFQAVWIDLHRSLGALRQAGGVRSWLITATMRRCLLHKKRRERHAGVPLEQAGPGVSDGAPDPLAIQEEAEQQQAVRTAIRQLPPRCRDMVRMLFLEDPPLPYAEVAQRLGLAEGSIGFIRRRCLDKLREALRR